MGDFYHKESLLVVQGVFLCLVQVCVIILSKWIRGVELRGEVETAGIWCNGSQQADEGGSWLRLIGLWAGHRERGELSLDVAAVLTSPDTGLRSHRARWPLGGLRLPHGLLELLLQLDGGLLVLAWWWLRLAMLSCPLSPV